MKDVLEAEKFQGFDPFAPAEAGPIAKSETATPAETRAKDDSEPILDGLITTLKLVFLFLPGAAVIHLIMIGFGMLFLYGFWSPGILVGSLGGLIVSVFMVMLGIGKLTDLRYLRVPAILFLSGTIFGIIYAIAASMVPGDFYGRFIWLTFPLTLTFGYLIKRRTDKDSTEA
ncbi:MAG: hypothetical protein ABL984_08475 [Pyrinomonadaceae bacterium]